MIRQRGGAAIEYPLFDIKPVTDHSRVLEIAGSMHRFKIVIFVSRNAVQYGLPFFRDCLKPTEQTLLAVGQSTAAKLVEAGFNTVRFPDNGANSENLLGLPELQKEKISTCDVLIVRGTGGREFLAQTLIERGARVEYAEVYERDSPCYDPDHENVFWKKVVPDIVMFTSLEAVDTLLQRVPSEYRYKVLDACTVVMSERIANCVREKGFGPEPVVVDQSDDLGLLDKCEEIARSMPA